MNSFISRIIWILVAILSVKSIDCSSHRKPKKQPHIILIVADDLGWNDVGFHGSIQIPTPNIDALAYNGVILDRHYVQPTCTPSRAALLTGKYPIRYGLQGTPIAAGQVLALPLSEKILPQHLKDLGYSTHLVGKWHLGSYKKAFTPTLRGFDSHFGYWNGYLSYTNSTCIKGSMVGIDARRGLKKAGNEMINRYATDVFTEEATKVIKSFKHQQAPMFLMVSHLAVHSGNHGLNHLEVSNKTQNDIRFDYIQNENRQLFAGMLTSLDESVGSVIEALDENEMLKDSIILFISDNGAPTDDPLWGYENFGSNWPLRGEKGGLLEGGVRCVGTIWSPWLKKKNVVSENLFHITDWLPTLYTAAGGNVENLGNIDGVNQWTSLNNTLEPIRSTILINIDESRGEEALIFDQWKVIKSNRTSDLSCYLKYSGDPGDRGPQYDMPNVINSVVGSRLSKINCLTFNDDCIDTCTMENLFYKIRSRARIDVKKLCSDRISNVNPDYGYECFDGYCLFDIQSDPCEYRNLAKENEKVLNLMINMLDRYKQEVVKQNPPENDPDANPNRFGGYWETWLDETLKIDL